MEGVLSRVGEVYCYTVTILYLCHKLLHPHGPQRQYGQYQHPPENYRFPMFERLYSYLMYFSDYHFSARDGSRTKSRGIMVFGCLEFSSVLSSNQEFDYLLLVSNVFLINLRFHFTPPPPTHTHTQISKEQSIYVYNMKTIMVFLFLTNARAEC